jgi:hypothetical protein
MRRASFNDGRTVGAKVNSFVELIIGSGAEPAQVTLPRDALIGAGRNAG